MVGPGDFSGDGCADLITRRADNGTLRLYNGDCAGGFGAGAGAVIASGWNQFNWIAAPGDFSGDGCMDLFTRTASGTLQLYVGDCHGGLGNGGAPVSQWAGWAGFSWIF